MQLVNSRIVHRIVIASLCSYRLIGIRAIFPLVACMVSFISLDLASLFLDLLRNPPWWASPTSYKVMGKLREQAHVGWRH